MFFLYMKEHKIKLPYSLDAYMGTSEEVGMFDIDHFVAHYPCPELSLCTRQRISSMLWRTRKF